MSTTTVTVHVDPFGRRARLQFAAGGGTERGPLRPRVLSSGARSARVALVAQGALLLAGDSVRVEVGVGAGAQLELVEPAGTVAYDMRGGSATWDVDIRLEAGADLVWSGEPFVVAQGARVRRTTSVCMERGARALMRETLVLGRTGERPGELAARTRVEYDGRPLLAEDLDLGDGSARVGILGSHRVVDTVTQLGVRSEPTEDPPAGVSRFRLPLAGTMWRSLASQAHEATLDSTWRVAFELATNSHLTSAGSGTAVSLPDRFCLHALRQRRDSGAGEPWQRGRASGEQQ